MPRSATSKAEGRESLNLPISSWKYRPDIDGLRAVAITSVILFHTGIWPFQSGYVGVDIFFAISGYLIGGIIYRGTETGRFSLITFYARRARRILPMLFVVISASIIAGISMLTASELERLAKSTASALTATSNIYFWFTRDYFSPDARLEPMLMTWSLGAEEQFYIFFPLFLLAVSRFRQQMRLLSLIALTALSLILYAVTTAKAPAAAFYLLPSRAWELAAGAALAVWHAQSRRKPSRILTQSIGITGLLILALSVVGFDQGASYPATILSVLGTIALILSEGSWVNTNLLAHPIPVKIGLISYSWYLWHWPLMAFARLCSVRAPSVLVLCSLALIALLLAVISWRFVEKPCRSAVSANGPTIVAYVAGSVALILVSVWFDLAKGLPQRVSQEVARIESIVSRTHNNPCVSYGSIPKLSPSCVSAERQQPVIAIIGDSHAAALGPGLQKLAEQNGWAVDIFTKPSCRPLRGVTVWRRDQPNLARDCSDFMESVFTRLLNDRAVVSVVLVGFWSGPIINPEEEERYYAPSRAKSMTSRSILFAEGLDRAVRDLLLARKRVILAGDVPFWPFDPARKLLVKAIPLRAAIEHALESSSALQDSLPKYKNDANEIVSRVALSTGASFIDLSLVLCPERVCHYRDGEFLFYADQSHLSEQGAIRVLAPWTDILFHHAAAESSKLQNLPGRMESGG